VRAAPLPLSRPRPASRPFRTSGLTMRGSPALSLSLRGQMQPRVGQSGSPHTACASADTCAHVRRDDLAGVGGQMSFAVHNAPRPSSPPREQHRPDCADGTSMYGAARLATSLSSATRQDLTTSVIQGRKLKTGPWSGAAAVSHWSLPSCSTAAQVVCPRGGDPLVRVGPDHARGRSRSRRRPVQLDVTVHRGGQFASAADWVSDTVELHVRVAPRLSCRSRSCAGSCSPAPGEPGGNDTCRPGVHLPPRRADVHGARPAGFFIRSPPPCPLIPRVGHVLLTPPALWLYPCCPA